MLYLQGHPQSGSDAGRPPEKDPQQHPADESSDESDHLCGGVRPGPVRTLEPPSLLSAGTSEEQPWPPHGLQPLLQTVSGSFQLFGPFCSCCWSRQRWSCWSDCSRITGITWTLLFPPLRKESVSPHLSSSTTHQKQAVGFLIWPCTRCSQS